jgi:hypothetical protein
MKILMKDRIGPPTVLKTLNFENKDFTTTLSKIRIPSDVRQAPRNTPIYFQIDKIYRKNYLGRLVEDKRFTEQERTFFFVRR